MSHPEFKRILDTLAHIHEEKDAEYSFDGEPLGNYRNNILGLPAWHSAMLRASEKWHRMRAMYAKGEDWRDNEWLDIIAHLINAYILYKEEFYNASGLG